MTISVLKWPVDLSSGLAISNYRPGMKSLGGAFWEEAIR